MYINAINNRTDKSMANGSGKSEAEKVWGALYWMFFIALAVVTILALSGVFGGKAENEPSPSPSSSWNAGIQTVAPPPGGQVVEQNPVIDMLPGCKVEGKIPVSCIEHLTLEEREMITCENEDGNTNGKWCIWIDKQTRDIYYVDGSEYRN